MMEHIDDEANENEFPIKLLRWIHLNIHLLWMVAIQYIHSAMFTVTLFSIFGWLRYNSAMFTVTHFWIFGYFWIFGWLDG